MHWLVIWVGLVGRHRQWDWARAALCVIFMILVSLENVKKYFLAGCMITSKAKINIVWNFFSLRALDPSGLHSKKFQTLLILAFEARENETKIEKITHSEPGTFLCTFCQIHHLAGVWNFSTDTKALWVINWGWSS